MVSVGNLEIPLYASIPDTLTVVLLMYVAIKEAIFPAVNHVYKHNTIM